jgi:glycosyltransferase involved in cell wall biosynthesis
VSARVAVVVPVHGNEATLPALAARLATALGDRTWRLRLVVDASPDGSAGKVASLPRNPASASPCCRSTVGSTRR